jgi:hypothetical protein
LELAKLDIYKILAGHFSGKKFSHGITSKIVTDSKKKMFNLQTQEQPVEEYFLNQPATIFCPFKYNKAVLKLPIKMGPLFDM